MSSWALITIVKLCCARRFLQWVRWREDDLADQPVLFSVRSGDRACSVSGERFVPGLPQWERLNTYIPVVDFIPCTQGRCSSPTALLAAPIYGAYMPQGSQLRGASMPLPRLSGWYTRCSTVTRSYCDLFQCHKLLGMQAARCLCRSAAWLPRARPHASHPTARWRAAPQTTEP